MSQYWLVKQEPTAYSWDQFAADGKTDWTGVRNFQARNNLRSMKLSDPVFYYHSVNGKAVVGLAKVTKEAFRDPTAAEGDWSAVELTPVKPIEPPVTLEQIKSRGQAAGHAFAEEFKTIRDEADERAIRDDPRSRKNCSAGHTMKTLGEIAQLCRRAIARRRLAAYPTRRPSCPGARTSSISLWSFRRAPLPSSPQARFRTPCFPRRLRVV